MLHARQEGDSYRRVEVITGQRRRCTGEEKARIVAESFEEGANISEVARCNGVARGLLTVWRHQALRGNRDRDEIQLRAPRPECDHVVYLEPAVQVAFVKFIERIVEGRK
nr:MULTISPECIES: transposase [Bradyrhizobium]